MHVSDHPIVADSVVRAQQRGLLLPVLNSFNGVPKISAYFPAEKSTEKLKAPLLHASYVKVLVLNGGSSTLKFQLLEIQAPDDEEDNRTQGEALRIAQGTVEKIGGETELEFSSTARGTETTLQESKPAVDHAEAARMSLRWLFSSVLSWNEYTPFYSFWAWYISPDSSSVTMPSSGIFLMNA